MKSESKSPTPLTDALDGLIPSNGVMIACCNGTGDYIKRSDYRNLELKLREVEHQLDGARKQQESKITPALVMDYARVQAERDRLIKVVDELAHGIEAFRDHGFAKHGTHYDVMMKCYESYSLLPHVQAKKGTI